MRKSSFYPEMPTGNRYTLVARAPSWLSDRNRPMTTTLNPAQMLDDAMRDRRRTNIALSKALAVQPNVVSMMRTGRLVIPAQRAVPIARWAGLDPIVFVQACIASYPENGPWQAFAAGLAMAGEIQPAHPCGGRYKGSSSQMTA